MEGTPVYKEQEDEVTYNFGMSYDFGVAKAMMAAQYYTGADSVGHLADVGAKGEDLEGYSVSVGTSIPMFGGDFKVEAVYGDGEEKATGREYEGFNFGAMYYYPLSKQFRVYSGVGYKKMEGTVDNLKTEDEAIRVAAGMTYYF